MPVVGRAQRALTVRQNLAISSQKCGILERGDQVMVLRMIISKSGTVRAQITRSPGARPAGWVTSYKGGVEMLQMSSAAEIRGGFYTSAVSLYNSSREPSPTSKERAAAAAIVEVEMRYERMRERLARNRVSLVERASAYGMPPAASSQAGDEQQSAAPQTPPRNKKGAKQAPLIKAAKLTAKAKELHSRAKEEEGKTFETISTKLVALLALKKKPVDELIREWDRKYARHAAGRTVLGSSPLPLVAWRRAPSTTLPPRYHQGLGIPRSMHPRALPQ